ncbi:MAG: hypothetical protein Q7J06_11320, partial [Bacteroidales bacterium]|nr:hypothetical protein [Bacteroidales bacterium]
LLLVFWMQLTPRVRRTGQKDRMKIKQRFSRVASTRLLCGFFIGAWCKANAGCKSDSFGSIYSLSFISRNGLDACKMQSIFHFTHALC